LGETPMAEQLLDWLLDYWLQRMRANTSRPAFTAWTPVPTLADLTPPWKNQTRTPPHPRLPQT
jgi:hypothetical protein